MSETAAQQQGEVEQLRARVAELERELAERTERANAAIAAAQDRLYWLDAWKIDLDAIMQRPIALRAFAAARQLGRAKRLAGRVLRRLTR